MVGGHETFEKDVRKYVEHESNQHDDVIKSWERYRGKDAKSMISLIIPPNDQISRVLQFLENELRTFETEEGSNYHSLWSRVRGNRPSFSVVIKCVIRDLKSKEKFGIHPNGLAMYYGLAFYGDWNKAEMVENLSVTPLPVKDFLYACDDRFHAETFKELVHSWKLSRMVQRYEIFQNEISLCEEAIESLERWKGNGPKSMISLMIPPGDQISRVVQSLEDELRSSDIEEGNDCHGLWRRAWVNRPSSGDVIRHVLKNMKLREKLGEKIPPNGFVRFYGWKTFKEGKTIMSSDRFVPLTPIKDFLCACDDRFHLVTAKELVESWKLSLENLVQSDKR